MNRLLTVALTLFIACSANAQKVFYKTLEDNPQLPFIQVQLSPFMAEACGMNMGIGIGAGGVLNLGNTLSTEVHFNHLYLDMGYHDVAQGIPAQNFGDDDFSKTNFLEAGATLKFQSEVKKKEIKVVLSSRTSGNTTYTNYIMVPATVLKQTGLRGGFFIYNTPLSTDKLPNEYAEDADGNQFTIYSFIDSSGADTYLSGGLDWGTQMNSIGFYAGLSFQTTTGLMIKPDGMREKKHKSHGEFFIDAFFAPITTFRDITYNGKDYDVSGRLPNQFSANLFGARLGYEYSFLNGPVSMGYRMELGYRPGLKKKGFYINLSYYLPLINLKAK